MKSPLLPISLRPRRILGGTASTAWALCLLFFTPVTLLHAVDFGSATNFTAGTAPRSVAVGDLNGDGKPDLAVANFDSANVSIRLGDGTGGFGAATNFAVGSSPMSVAVGDLNGDGKPDLAVANSNSNNVSILLGNGNGGFNAATNFAAGSSPRSVAVGDLNGDGKPDLAVANAGSDNVSILLGNGNGGFGAVTNFPVGTMPFSVAVGDLNGDGKLDLATANYFSTNVSILLGTGTGNFGAATNFAVGTYPSSVAVGDLNGDGQPDLATANYLSNNVSILLGTGNGGFGAATNFPMGTGPRSVAVGDLNGDGKPDLAVANSSNVSILLGNGNGGFGAVTDFAAGTFPVSVVMGDLNGDGQPDLATTDYLSNNVSVLLNLTVPATSVAYLPASNFDVDTFPSSVAVVDLNGDGKPDLATSNNDSATVSIRLGDGTGSFGAATSFAVGTSPYSMAVGDLNGDGKPDLATSNQTNNNVSILLGTGTTGSFGAAPNSPVGVGSIPHSVAVGDLNGDGKLDLAVANSHSNDVSILLGDGTGSFSAAPNSPVGVGTNPFPVAVGDFNGDGKPDLAVANYGSNNVSILLGNGAGSFSMAPNSPVGVGTHPFSVAVGDLNRDGKPDLAVANTDSNNVSVLLGDGTGSFGAATNFLVGVGTQPISVAVGDLNSDGKPDLATANYGGNNVSVLLGNGAGSFSTAANFPVGTRPRSVAVGDLNGDGKPDLAVANSGSDNVSVLLAAPEIAVTETGVSDIADGGSFSFGTAVTGQTVTKTFTITNSGPVALTLSNLTVPAGFSIAQNFGSTTVASGSSTTFQITMITTAPGSPSGALTFDNNDGDENPFNFTISGTINKGDTNTVITSSNPTSLTGTSVTLTATVTAVAPAAGTPTGSVQFYLGGNPLAVPISLANGQATLTTNTLPVGNNSITAVYSGDAGYNVSTSSAITQRVVTVNPTPAQVGTTATLNKQIGISELVVNVKNTTASDINGFRLFVDYSAYLGGFPTLKLYNATSPSNVSPPYIEYSFPMAVDQSVSLTLQFYTVNRVMPNPFVPVLTLQSIPPSLVTHINDTGIPVTNIVHRVDGSILLEFNTVAGNWYRVSYTHDMHDWYYSPVPIKAGSNKTQWIDNGPPGTDSPPVSSRFYSVSQIAAP